MPSTTLPASQRKNKYVATQQRLDEIYHKLKRSKSKLQSLKVNLESLLRGGKHFFRGRVIDEYMIEKMKAEIAGEEALVEHFEAATSEERQLLYKQTEVAAKRSAQDET